LKLQYHEALSNFALSFNLRHYNKVAQGNSEGAVKARAIFAALGNNAVAGEVGRGVYCSPNHATHLEPSSLELISTLCRGAQYPPGLELKSTP
jgi:hypothetical protein